MRRLLTFGILIIALALLALALQGVVVEGIVIPVMVSLARFRLMLLTVPQVTIWYIFAICAALALLIALMGRFRLSLRRRQAALEAEGQVEKMARVLSNSRSGIYSRWMLANRLGGIARAILLEREGEEAMQGKRSLEGRDWDPPEEIQKYLDAGLNRSFIDAYPTRRWFFFRSQPTAFDVPPENVIAYLESQMETKE